MYCNLKNEREQPFGEGFQLSRSFGTITLDDSRKECTDYKKMKSFDDNGIFAHNAVNEGSISKNSVNHVLPQLRLSITQ